MKRITPILLIFIASTCLAQPTGHQKLFLEVMDMGSTVHFKNRFDQSGFDQLKKIEYQGYELIDISSNATGFRFYPANGLIHKTLMTNDHHILIVKNNKDTMNIEILNAFNIYFLGISFQKGHFKFYVNDLLEHRWAINTLPFKYINHKNTYDITPPDWEIFRVSNAKVPYDYFISKQYARLNILVNPVAPQDDPNFRNPRRVNHLKKEVADYNFDGQKDYREHKLNDSTRWNYFIYTNMADGFVLDTLLSKLDFTTFDFEKKTFIGQKTTRVDPKNTQVDNYEFINGKFTLVRQMLCVHAFPNSERMDCSVYVLKNGEMVFKELIKGCE
jgi:hypothetical protein